MLFLDRITEMVRAKGITKNKLLADLGLNKSSFFDWERRGTVPGGDTVAKIADYFHVSTDYLLGRTDDPRPLDEKEPAPIAEGGPDPELWKLIQQIPESRMPEVERFLRFQAEPKEKP